MIAGPLVFVDVDTQRDFLDPSGSLFIPGSGAILRNLASLSRFARERGVPVIATSCAHTIDEDDPDTARAFIRSQVAGRSNRRSPYETNLRRLGYTDDDFAGGGSDRLIDARYVYGDDDAVAARLHAHLDAGADSVLIYVTASDLTKTVHRLETLAAHLHLR